MLSKELNEKLTQTGPDTPMGRLLRYYWYPIAGSAELEENPVKKVRLLSEDLVLYRDRSCRLGLIDEPCPHRRVSMEYGIPEADGLRCPYHGWVFNAEGRCLEQPAEPWDSTFKDRVTTKAYPVQELGGLIFAYLGPQPAPLLPRYDVLVWDNVIRQAGVTMLPCNWIQCMENSLDPTHVQWLHGYYMDYVWQRKGKPITPYFRAGHTKIGFDRFEHGIVKRRIVEGNTEEDDPWRVGHPVIFPHILRVGGGGTYTFQIRVPVDDTHTWHMYYNVYHPGVEVPKQESVPVYEIPIQDERGRFTTEMVAVQDMWAWVTQGPIAKRELERLGQSDVGIIMFRDLLLEQLGRVERGEEPTMGVFRDPAQNVCIDIPQEQLSYDTRMKQQLGRQFRPGQIETTPLRFSPAVDLLRQVFQEADDRAARGETLIPFPEAPAVPVGPGHKEVVLIKP